MSVSEAESAASIVTLSVTRKDLEFVLDWAEGGLAEYSHRNMDTSAVDRVRQALSHAKASEPGESEQLPRCQDCGRPMPSGRCILSDCFSTWGQQPEASEQGESDV